MRFVADASLYRDTAACLDALRALPPPPPPTRRHPCHLWWHGPFGAKQVAAVRAFLATQDPARTELVLWLDGDEPSPELGEVRVERYDADDLAAGTPVEGRSDLLDPGDVVQRSNLARYLILHRHGGLYLDADTLVLRDLGLLLDDPAYGEFTYRWSGSQLYANGAVLRYGPGGATSQAILERCAEIGTGRGPACLTFAGTEHIDLLVLPSACFDPLWAHVDGDDVYADAPFATWSELFTAPAPPGAGLDTFFPGAFAYHWHNQWDVDPAPGSWWDAVLADIVGGPGR